MKKYSSYAQYIIFSILIFGYAFNSVCQVVKPNYISGLQLWLKADSAVTYDGSFKVSQWNDCSGNANHSVQSNSSYQPSWTANTLNSKPVIRFDGIDDFMEFNEVTNIQSCFFVVKTTDISKFTPLLGHATQYPFYDVPGSDLFDATYTSPNILSGLGYVNGVNTPPLSIKKPTNYTIISLIATGNLSVQYITNDRNIPNRTWKGDYAEIILYNRALTAQERQAVEHYLDQKYANPPAVNLGPDIHSQNFCPDTLNAGPGFIHYAWSTGNPGDTLQKLIVNSSGSYWVTATDNFGFNSTDTINLYKPVINLNDTALCAGSNVTLNPGLTGTYSYLWSNGQTTPTINVNIPGSYYVKITDALTCFKNSDTISVNLDNYPNIVSFSNDTLSLCSGSVLQLSSGNTQAISYQWSTNESSSTIQVFSPGFYSVTAVDNLQCSGVDTAYVAINGVSPTTDFSYTASCSNDTTYFLDLTNPSTGITGWLWNFGDGYSSNNQNPSHLYLSPGNYIVTLSVNTLSGCNGFKSKNIFIKQSPIVSFNAEDGCLTYPVDFHDTSVPSPGDSIISWTWNFDDPSSIQDTSILENPNHLFTAPGNYNVILTVSTLFGCSTSVISNVNIVSSSPFPSYATLLFPYNGYFLNSDSVNFKWSVAQGAVRYRLLLATDSTFNNIIYVSPKISVDSFQYNSIPFAPFIFWKINSFNICNDSTSSVIYKIYRFTSQSEPGCLIWFASDSGVVQTSNKINEWKDLSGNNNHAYQLSSLLQPDFIDSVLNNKPVIRFDGTDDFMSFNEITNIRTCFFVVKTTDISKFSPLLGHPTLYPFYNVPGNSLFDITNSSSYIISGQGFVNSIATPPSMMMKPLEYSIISLVTTNNISSQYITNDRDIPGRVWKGDFAEIILYNLALSSSQRGFVEDYLHQKYCPLPPVELGSDIYSTNLCSIELDAGPRYTHYNWSTGDTTQKIFVSTGGTYTVTTTCSFGYRSTDSVIVHKPIITVFSDTLCLGDSTTLHSGLGAPFTTYWEWNNDTTWNEAYTAHAGETINLHVKDTSGCELNRQIIIHADNFPALNLLGSSNMNACTGDVIFLDTAAVDTSKITSYDWLADGIHYNTPTFTVPPSWISGAHPLSLTVTNGRGCIATDNVTIHIQGAQPNVGFNFTSVCFPGNGNNTFNDNSTATGGATIDHYYWNFGDGSTANLSNSNLFSHHYDSAAYYTVTLTDTTNQGCYKSFTQVVPVYSVPVPHFQPHLGCQGALLQLHDQSTSTIGNINSWNWTFDDPNNPQVSNNTNPTHVFDSLGYYYVHLVVTTEYGCTDTLTDSVRIRYAPVAGFTYTDVCDGNPVYFTDTTHTEIWAPVIGWNWDFGNGQTSAQESPVYAFDSAGTYQVVLAVHSLNGCIVTDTQQVVVHAIPTAALVLNDYCAQTPYTLHDISSVLSPDFITSWHWNFGSLGTSNNSTPVLTFNNTGAYPVTLTVTSNAGCQSTAHDSMHVFPIPVAGFLPSQYYCTAPCNITFTNNSLGGELYQWTFGDTASIGSTQFEPSHTYNYDDSNGFPVVLYVTNTFGCSDSAYLMVFVTPTSGNIMVSNVQAVKQNGFVTLSARITNMGTRSVYSIDVYAKAAGGTAYKEIMDLTGNPLKPGEDTLYTFTGQYQLSDQQVTEYICVEAQITNYVPDDDPSNNEQCLAFTTQFVAFEPYPSPVNDHVNIDFILPFEDNVVIELYGMKGEKVKDIYSGVAQKGLNQITLDVSDLALAVYTYRILYRDDQKILKFVKY